MHAISLKTWDLTSKAGPRLVTRRHSRTVRPKKLVNADQRVNCSHVKPQPLRRSAPIGGPSAHGQARIVSKNFEKTPPMFPKLGQQTVHARLEGHNV
jgi:hypothetical protein